ncbi:WD40/YVTN/BNR-like repeat-containing protein [Brevibacillus sp. SYSU BS000544]|uniref:WD40/YVTN/BNR-like repeat-containing protein n=1 Tax=Brevibacillus sp. SYSU BS000544 TaxID=3416443 RepID=UPI003CE5AF95
MKKRVLKHIGIISGLLAALLVGCEPADQAAVNKAEGHSSAVQAAQIPGDLTFQDVLQKGEQIHFVSVSPKESRILLGTHAGLYASASGNLWSIFSSGLEKKDISGWFTDPENPKWLYVGGNRVSQYSDDGGKTWRESTKGLPQVLNIRCVTGVRENEQIILYAYIENEGVFQSADGGRSWGKFSTVTSDVYAMDYDQSESRLYMLTQDGLIYEQNGQWNQEAIPDATQLYSFSVDRENRIIYLASDKGVMMKQDNQWEMMEQQLPEQAMLLSAGPASYPLVAVGESASLYTLQNNEWIKWE